MRRLFVCLLYVSAAFAQTQSKITSSLNARIYSVDDALKREDILGAEFDRSGNVLFVNQQIAEVEAHHFTFALDVNVSEVARTQFRVFRLGPGGNLKLPLESKTGMELTQPGLSPDQRYMAFLDGRGVVPRVGVYDLQSGHSREFAVTPAEQGAPFHWTPDGKLYLSATSPERSSNAFPMEMARSWHDMEMGHKSTASVAGSGKFAKDWNDDLGQSLVLIDPGSGKTRIVGHGYGVRAARFSPDNRWVATVHYLSEKRDPASLVSPTTVAQYQLVLYDRTGEVPARMVCPTCEVEPTSLKWSQDGRTIAFLARTPHGNEAWLYQPSSDIAEPIPTTHGATVNQIAWTGNDVAVWGQLDSGSRWLLVGKNFVDLNSAFEGATVQIAGAIADGVILVSKGAVWKVTTSGERHLLLSARSGKTNLWQPPGAQNQPLTGLVLETQSPDGSAKSVTLLDLTTRKSVVVKAPVPDAEIEAVSMLGSRIAFKYHRDKVEFLSVADGGGTNRVVLRMNEYLENVVGGRSITVSYRGPHGDDLSACLLLPPGYKGDGPLPTVVDVYPDHICDPGNDISLSADIRYPLHPANQHEILAGHGYAVLIPSYEKYTTIPRDPSSGITETTLSAVDAAIATGFVDKTRLAIMGGSFGGYAVAVIITHSDRFKAAVDESGDSDLLSFALLPRFEDRRELEFRSGDLLGSTWTETGQGGMGAPPWHDPERYIRNSPVFSADTIHTPLMLIHGDLDGTVPFTQSEELFTALLRQKKDAQFVRYWGEGHRLAMSPANARDYYRRISDWFDRYIGPPFDVKVGSASMQSEPNAMRGAKK